MRVNKKILLILISAFFLSTILSRSVFLVNTPRLNPVFIAKMNNLAESLKNPAALLSSVFNRQPKPPSTGTIQIAGLNLPEVKNVSNVIFKPVSKNIYAAVDKQNNIQYITIKKGAKMEVRLYQIRMSNGVEKEIKLLVPVNPK